MAQTPDDDTKKRLGGHAAAWTGLFGVVLLWSLQILNLFLFSGVMLAGLSKVATDEGTSSAGGQMPAVFMLSIGFALGVCQLLASLECLRGVRVLRNQGDEAAASRLGRVFFGFSAVSVLLSVLVVPLSYVLIQSTQNY